MRISPMEIQVFKVKKVKVLIIKNKSGNRILRRNFLPCWKQLRRKMMLEKNGCKNFINQASDMCAIIDRLAI